MPYPANVVALLALPSIADCNSDFAVSIADLIPLDLTGLLDSAVGVSSNVKVSCLVAKPSVNAVFVA